MKNVDVVVGSPRGLAEALHLRDALGLRLADYEVGLGGAPRGFEPGESGELIDGGTRYSDDWVRWWSGTIREIGSPTGFRNVIDAAPSYRNMDRGSDFALATADYFGISAPWAQLATSEIRDGWIARDLPQLLMASLARQRGLPQTLRVAVLPVDADSCEYVDPGVVLVPYRLGKQPDEIIGCLASAL